MELTIWKHDGHVGVSPTGPPFLQNRRGFVHHEARHHEPWENNELGHIISCIFERVEGKIQIQPCLTVFKVYGEHETPNCRVLNVSEAISMKVPADLETKYLPFGSKK